MLCCDAEEAGKDDDVLEGAVEGSGNDGMSECGVELGGLGLLMLL
jgi:hypothetical protein